MEPKQCEICGSMDNVQKYPVPQIANNVKDLDDLPKYEWLCFCCREEAKVE